VNVISLQKSLGGRIGGAVLVLLMGCSFARAQEPKLSGTWVFSDGTTRLTLQLNEDGSAALQGKAFSYTARGNRLVLVDDKGAVSSYSYELRNDVLTIAGPSLPRVLDFKRLESLDGAAKSESDSGSTNTTPRGPFSRKNAAEEEDTGLAGKWQSSEIVLQIFNDGKLTINGEQFNYRVDGRHVVLSNIEGSVRVEFQLNGDTLTTNYQGERTVYRRVRGGSSAAADRMSESQGANPAELAGKWCYMSNVTANDGGRMSNTCFTLYPNGTYEYYSETSSSNPYGGTSSQSSDSGTWSVSGGTLIANSRSRGRQVYTLEKRNHPKTGDPMLLVDGDAFVTYTQRRPW
jgi:hypothetical protein